MTKHNLIIGAGGHGKVIADILQCQGMSVMGFLDDNPAIIGTTVFDLPVLGAIDTWRDFEPDGVIIGIGDNHVRSAVAHRLGQDITPPWLTAVHPRSTVARSVRVGMGTVVMAGAIINADTVIGQHAIINTAATVDHDCILGNFVHIAPGAHLAGDIHIDEGALLGIGSVVIPGRKIGKGAIIGAGAVVISDVPPGVMAKGLPAVWNQ